ncbi:unnamed protein product [Rotaria magnacalcarata]|uniref:Uncharacterized protein n=1 Tax=Rotaria magnacalcarata TaxID=392030 RepID=A0A819WSN3_9BILA|nr:unnamed protein product [Rotaria magnacalcarata]CAF4126988.1 unnamed protein product [Rotaria magnacalcarata]
MFTQRRDHRATLISQDNSVLITGGIGSSGTHASTEKYLPSTGCFKMVGIMSTSRAFHTADQLSSLSGLVLIAGGSNSQVFTADLFDPMTGNTSTIFMLHRTAHTSTILSSPTLMLIGGLVGIGFSIKPQNTGQLFAVGTPPSFKSVPNTMTDVRQSHTATRLGDSSDLVLIVGGFGNSFLSSASLYNMSSNMFVPLAAKLPTVLAFHTAAYLPPPINKVLIAGGHNGSNYLNTLIVFDAVTLSFTTVTSTMSTGRSQHTATLLSNGKVLIVGGLKITDSSLATNTCDVIDTANNTFSSIPAPNLQVGRYAHTATLLTSNNGDTVLVCGGNNDLSATLNSCELYFV